MLIRVTVNDKPVPTGSILEVESGLRGFVKIEDTSLLQGVNSEEVSTPGEENLSDLPRVQLPVKTLRGNVVVRLLNVDEA